MSLASAQSWLWQAILGSGEAALESAEMIHEGGFGRRERLAIYGSGYRMRLLECMRACYPLLRSALDETLFDTFSLAYISAAPSTSYNLHQLGAGFPDHLAATRPAPSDEDDGAWADFMIALARFERALYEVYDGPGDEHGNTTDAQMLSRSLRLLELTHPVHECLHADQAGQPVVAMAPRPTCLALSRVAFRVVVEPLNAVEQGLYRRMLKEGVASGVAEVRAGVGADGLQRWLARQVERGLMTGATVQQPVKIGLG